MTREEAIHVLKQELGYLGGGPSPNIHEYEEALQVAIDALRMPPPMNASIAIYDKEEIHHDCTVQILTNSVTGEQSIGWWHNDRPPVMKP